MLELSVSENSRVFVARTLWESIEVCENRNKISPAVFQMIQSNVIGVTGY